MLRYSLIDSNSLLLLLIPWRGVRVAEGARLEIVYGVKLIEGSTPSLSV